MNNSFGWEWISESVEQTESFGFFLARQAQPNDVISLDGDLGAGKTALTRGIAAGMGLRGYVTSPTFTILIEHQPNEKGMALYHFDAYRLENATSFYECGFDEYLSMDGLSVIEWGNIIEEALPAQTLFISLLQTTPDKPQQRLIRLNWPGNAVRLQKIINEFKMDLFTEKHV